MLFCKLTELNEGSFAIIRSVEKEDFTLKLLEMGLVPGEKLHMENNNKSRSPIIVRLGGSSISLRREEAECIVVECII